MHSTLNWPRENRFYGHERQKVVAIGKPSQKLATTGLFPPGFTHSISKMGFGIRSVYQPKQSREHERMCFVWWVTRLHECFESRHLYRLFRRMGDHQLSLPRGRLQIKIRRAMHDFH